MKYLVRVFILLVSTLSFSQEQDSIGKPKKPFKFFFGCDCCPEDDTIRKEQSYRQKWMIELTLYRSQYVLVARKKGRVTWKRDLRDYLKEEAISGSCIFDGGKDAKGRERVIVSTRNSAVLVLYLRNGKRVHFDQSRLPR